MEDKRYFQIALGLCAVSALFPFGVYSSTLRQTVRGYESRIAEMEARCRFVDEHITQIAQAALVARSGTAPDGAGAVPGNAGAADYCADAHYYRAGRDEGFFYAGRSYPVGTFSPWGYVAEVGPGGARMFDGTVLYFREGKSEVSRGRN